MNDQALPQRRGIRSAGEAPRGRSRCTFGASCTSVSMGEPPAVVSSRIFKSGRMNCLKAKGVGLGIYVEPDPLKAQEMFVDIADSAKSISSAVRALFDSYSG